MTRQEISDQRAPGNDVPSGPLSGNGDAEVGIAAPEALNATAVVRRTFEQQMGDGMAG